jgi:hypothetical protein
MLAYASPYFHGALEGQFREATEGVVALPHTTVKAFELAVGFIYQMESRFLKFDLKDFANEGKFISTMIELSALGQHLVMPTMEQCAASNLVALLNKSSSALTSQHVAYAFELLADTSEVRGTIVRATMAHFVGPSWDVTTRDISADWKFAEALEVPGYMGILLVLMKDYNMGRFRG